MKPLAIDLYCGLGGWAEGLLAEGWDVVGFDIERHDYGTGGYPGQLVLQDVTTLHGRFLKDASLIVCSPPCQEYSYMAMPWKLAKAKAAKIRADKTGRELERLNRLFDACFRIQGEASEAAGRHIPLIVENVRGAVKWVSQPVRWHYGSYFLWGDVPALMPITLGRLKLKGGDRNIGRADGSNVWNQPEDRLAKVPGFRFDGSGGSFQTASVEATGHKTVGMNWSDQTKRGQDFTRIAGQQAMEAQKRNPDGTNHPPGSWFKIADSKNRGARSDGEKGIPHRTAGHWTNPAEHEGTKNGNDWFGSGENCSLQRKHGSKSNSRKAASAHIAKIPFPLAVHIARSFLPDCSPRF